MAGDFGAAVAAPMVIRLNLQCDSSATPPNFAAESLFCKTLRDIWHFLRHSNLLCLAKFMTPGASHVIDANGLGAWADIEPLRGILHRCCCRGGGSEIGSAGALE